MRPFLVLLCVLGAIIWANKGKDGWGGGSSLPRSALPTQTFKGI